MSLVGLPGEERARMGTEREDRRKAAAAPGGTDGRLDHGAVPEVHAVEHADRQVEGPGAGSAAPADSTEAKLAGSSITPESRWEPPRAAGISRFSISGIERASIWSRVSAWATDREPDGGAAEGRQVGPAAELLAEVVREGPHIRALRAAQPEVEPRQARSG